MVGTDNSGGNQGPSTDSHNDPVVDPTKNVLDLVEAEKKRADDIREIDAKWRDKLDDLRASHSREMDGKETERIDAIRAVDVGNVQRAAEVQAGVAAALEGKVTATAAAFESRLTATIEPIQRRIDDLTRAQYEAQGQKTQVVETRATGANTGLWIGIAFGAFSLLLAVAAMAFSIYLGTR